MMLSGEEIKARLNKDIIISPFSEKQLNPNSYNLTLHNELLVYDNDTLDIRVPNQTGKIKIPWNGFCLLPGQLYLARTTEWTETNNLVPQIDGRSSIGRLGINIHVTASLGDVGFKGYWTLEISVIKSVFIYPGIEICKIYYHELKGDHEPYQGKYQHSHYIGRSALYEEFNYG